MVESQIDKIKSHYVIVNLNKSLTHEQDICNTESTSCLNLSSNI